VTTDTKSITVYRAGDPESGEGFWTPSPEYARAVFQEGALHVADILPGFKLRRFTKPRTAKAVDAERQAGDADVLCFPSPEDSTNEYVVLNPQALKIIQ
jgi:hypothetical protein